MSALQASHAIPGSSLGTGSKKTNLETGWLSRATYEGLPARFQAIALDLARRGEITIEGEETVRSRRMNERHHGTFLPA